MGSESGFFRVMVKSCAKRWEVVAVLKTNPMILKKQNVRNKCSSVGKLVLYFANLLCVLHKGERCKQSFLYEHNGPKYSVSAFFYSLETPSTLLYRRKNILAVPT